MAPHQPEQPIVYLVDDDQQQLLELEESLRHFELAAVAFSSGSELIDALYASTAPAIVVTDMRMPEISGWGVADAVNRLRTRGRKVALVLVTGFPEEVATRRALQLRVDDLIRKPLDPNELLASLRQLSASLETRAETSQVVTEQAGLSEVVDALFSILTLCDRRLPDAVRSESHLRMILYCVRQHLDGQPPCVSSTCYASRLPLTTALRRLQELVAAGMFEKVDDPEDKRRITVRPSDDLLARLEGLTNASSRVCQALGHDAVGGRDLDTARTGHIRSAGVGGKSTEVT